MNNFSGAQNITVNHSDNNLNQLTQRVVNAGPEQGTLTWGYDANGNMIWEQKGQTPIREFNYDFDDRMVTVSNPGDVLADIEYDALDRRLIHTDGITGQQTLYYYDGIRVILEKRKSGQSWQTSKVYTLQDGAISSIISEYINVAGVSLWYHYDRLGNVMDMTNEEGNVTTSFDQDAFGNVLEGNQSGYHLTTKEFSPSIALYYFYQRWYDPKLGRFITTSILTPDREHPYDYCSSNPTNLVDPEGKFSRQAGEYCLKEAKKIPNPKSCRKWPYNEACNTDAAADCQQAEDCLRRLGIDPNNTTWCHYELKEWSLGDRWGICWSFHQYCALVCDDTQDPGRNLD